MTQPVDRKGFVSQPPANAAALVGETLAFLVAWRRILSGTGPWPTAEVAKLREQSRALQARARELGVGGLAHHLQTCDDCLAFEVVDRAELSRRLRNVSELTSQLRQETDPIRSSRPPAVSAPSVSIPPRSMSEPQARGERAPVSAPPLIEAAPSAVETTTAPVGAAGQLEVAPGPPVPPPHIDARAPAADGSSTPPAVAASTTPEAAPDVASPQSAPPRPPSFGAPPSDAKREGVKSEAPRFQIPRPEGSLSSSRPRAASGASVPAPRPRAAESARPSAPVGAGTAVAAPALGGSPSVPVVPVAPVEPATQVVATPAEVIATRSVEVVAAPPEVIATRSVEVVASRPLHPVAPPPLEAVTPKAPETKPLGSSESATPRAPDVTSPKAPTRSAASDAPSGPGAAKAPVESSAARPPAASQPPRVASPSAPAPIAPEASSRPEPLSATPIASQTLDVGTGAAARATLDTLVGLTEAEAEDDDSRPSRPPVYVPPTAPPAPRRDVRPPELSVLARGAPDWMDSATTQELDPRRSGPPGPPPVPPALVAPPRESVPPPSSELDELPWQTSWNRPATRWWLLPVLAGIVAVVAVFWQEIRSYTAALRGAPAAQTTSEGPKQIALEPQPAPADLGERLRVLVASVHAYGNGETPELADLIDREAEVIGRALGQPCAGPTACAAAERARALLDPRVAPAPPEAEAARGLGAWLVGLALPGIGVRDVPIVQERVEFHTRYTTGREALQVLLFHCAAHRQTIVDSLLQHELPLDLMALPMAESGCSPDVENRVGARGLWQLTPQAAAAYHLEVVSEVLDERVSTTKATEAALRLLSDVHDKLGSWELALASYHVGPFELVAQLLRAQPETDFWRIATRGQFSDHTAAHVGRVQAFAVILANLQHFGFISPEPPEEEGTAELDVPAGTRLGIVARAAGSSLTRLRELNPELLADTLPDLPGRSFKLLVPSESVRRARQRLPGLIAAADAADRCVPYSFDWGRQRFTKAMASRCEYLSADLR